MWPPCGLFEAMAHVEGARGARAGGAHRPGLCAQPVGVGGPQISFPSRFFGASVGLFCFPASAIRAFSPFIPRYLVEEIKKREGFELVMEVGLLDPLSTLPPFPYMKPHKGPGRRQGNHPIPQLIPSSSLLTA